MMNIISKAVPFQCFFPNEGFVTTLVVVTDPHPEGPQYGIAVESWNENPLLREIRYFIDITGEKISPVDWYVETEDPGDFILSQLEILP